MTELKKPSVKNKVEAILFSVGHKINIDEVSRLSRSKKEEVLAALKELQREYEEKQSSVMLVDDGDFWKFAVKDHFIPIVRKIVTETELGKSVLETLAVIAFKYPILQSDMIRIRTNKAYDHLIELESSGYISRQKHGRTNLIKLTEKFFRYFDLTEDSLREKFKDFDSIAKAIKEKEEEIEKIKDEQRKMAKELTKEDEKIKQEIEALDTAEEDFEIPLETYEARPKELITEEFVNEENLIVEREKIGELEVVEDGQKIKTKKEHAQTKEKEDTSQNSQPSIEHKAQAPAEQEIKQILDEKEKVKVKKPKRKSEGIKLTPEMEKIVDEKVEEMLNPQQKQEE